MLLNLSSDGILPLFSENLSSMTTVFIPVSFSPETRTPEGMSVNGGRVEN
jgi:hypothetical protein